MLPSLPLLGTWLLCSHGSSSLLGLRVVERVEHVDQTIGEVINIKHLFNIWRV